MILVILGDTNQPFPRLMKSVLKQVDVGKIIDEVILETSRDCLSRQVKVVDSLTKEKREQLITQAHLIITYVGADIIRSGLRQRKKIIVIPRLKNYEETLNNNERLLVNVLAKKGFILPLDNADELDQLLLRVRRFKPAKYKSRKQRLIKILTNYIDHNLKINK
ncbi:MAG: glycosyltransferase [Bacilli bacterium]|jgi:UDP-N-acetylglucosamine transferase subunit ALG13|nr:glycosyltransferase [Bacilli bacterium]